MTSSRRSIAPEIDDAELRAILQLRMLPRLTDQKINEYLNSYSIAGVIEQQFHSEAEKLERRVDRALRMIDSCDVAVLTSNCKNYPERLKFLLGLECPPVLFLRGRTELLKTRGISVIGARNSTEYGDSVAEMFSTDLARRGFTIISGLARGIDSIAHNSALRVGGNTIAVLGCGIDVHYPRQNYKLQECIAEQGLLISEFPPGATAHPYHFPQRNRIIAMLGEGLVVIEAGYKSGTRQTVSFALDYDRHVFAIPGPIGRKESEGTNEAIRDGAQICTSVQDILTLIPAPEHVHVHDHVHVHVHEPSPPQNHLLNSLEIIPTHIDIIARKHGLTTKEALTQLLDLELEGVVMQYPGKRFSRTRL